MAKTKAAKPKTKPKPAPKPKRAPAEVRAPAPPPSGAIAGVLAIGDLRPSAGNPRKSFPDATLQDLAADIRLKGLLQRIIVRPIPNEGSPAPRLDDTPGRWVGVDHFEIVAGERRWRACQLAGLDRVPVDVRQYSDEQCVLLAQISENDHREDVRPSEQAAAYRRLADAGRTAEQIAADTGKGLSFVRGLLRLGRLPAWALAAVDAGVLPRATAELVARVPGEVARKRCAALAMNGFASPEYADDVDDLVASAESLIADPNLEPLSYRDAKDLVRNHFTKELKGSPFSLKVLYDVPGESRQIPSCDECPKRAGNDAEAIAEGTRADVCLDPDCYRAKVEAYRAAEIAKAADKGIEPIADDELRWPILADQPPVGWLDPKSALKDCPDLMRECVIASGEQYHAHKALAEMLGKLTPQQYLCFDTKGKPRKLLRQKDVRAALVDLGLIPKPEPRPKRVPLPDTGSEPATAATESPKSGKPLVAKVTAWEVDERAGEIAAGILREYTEEQCSELDGHEDAHEDGPIRAALELSLRAICYDLHMRHDEACVRVLKRLGAGPVEVDAAVAALRPSQMLAVLVELGATMELQFGNPERPTGESMLAFAELDWPQLQEQARRELTGEEPAEAKVAQAEAEPPAEARPVVHCAKCKATYDATGRDRCPSCSRPHEEQPVEPQLPDVPPAAGTPFAAVPGFPLEAADHLHHVHLIDTVEQLDAKVAEIRTQRGRGQADRYEALRELQVPYEVVYAAGDALVDWEAAKAAPAETPAPAAKAKPKKGAKGK